MTDYNEEEIADYQEDDLYGGENTINGGEIAESHDEVEPEEMKKRVQEMEEELDKLTKMQQQVEQQITSASDRIDENSIYVGQVDYEATPEELRAHFAPCGTINRITIMCDKITGQAKGFAYIEFLDKEAVDNALKLDDSQFKGRQLKVLPKRQNVPSGFARGSGGGRFGRGGGGPIFAGRGRGANGGRGFYPAVAAAHPYARGGGFYRGGGRASAFRGGGASYYPTSAVPVAGGGRFGRGRSGRSYNPYY